MPDHFSLTRSFARRASLIGVIGLAGCAQMPPLPQAPVVLTESSALPVAAGPPYRVKVGDELAIKLPLDAELNETAIVLPDGTISTSVAHAQPAAGMTLPQLDTALLRDYRSVLKHPVISAIVAKSAPTPIYILGAVDRPGLYQFDDATPRLAQAIAVAGGLKLGANPSEIYILRHLPDDRQQFLATKFSDLQSARNPDANVPLAPTDEIFVPRTTIARAYGYFNQYFQQFIATSASINYQVNSNGNTSVIPAH